MKKNLDFHTISTSHSATKGWHSPKVVLSVIIVSSGFGTGSIMLGPWFFKIKGLYYLQYRFLLKIVGLEQKKRKSLSYLVVFFRWKP